MYTIFTISDIDPNCNERNQNKKPRAQEPTPSQSIAENSDIEGNANDEKTIRVILAQRKEKK